MAYKTIPIGTKFGHLTVIGPGEPKVVGSVGKHQSTSICLCDLCGKQRAISNNVLLTGQAHSCGCAKYLTLKEQGKDRRKKPFYIVNGYGVFYDPDHPAAMKDGHPGYVYMHRLVAEQKLGRYLTEDETVHHIDHNKLNNSPDNLLVLSRSEHGQLHAIERAAVLGKDVTIISDTCLNCGKMLSDKKILKCNQRLCRSCVQFRARKVKNRPSRDELADLMAHNSMCAIGRMYGVSNKAIYKWAVGYGLR